MKQELKSIFIVMGLTIISTAILAITENLYMNIDNFNISLVTNGLFGMDDVYTYYLHPWLCILIKIIAQNFSTVDGYVILMHCLIIV